VPLYIYYFIIHEVQKKEEKTTKQKQHKLSIKWTTKYGLILNIE